MHVTDRWILKKFSSGCLKIHTNTWDAEKSFDDICILKKMMLLKKYENLLELSVEQLVIQSSLASSIALGQSMCGVWKTKMLMLLVAKLSFFYIQQDIYPSPSLI